MHVAWRSRQLLAAAFLGLSVPAVVHAQEWPRLRGPNGEGRAEATSIPLSWTPADCRWQVELPGIGYSSPVVNGNRVFLTSADEKTGDRYILCYDARTGDTVWERTLPSKPYKKNKDCALASATPALDRQRVFSTWATSDELLVVALDQGSGKEVWRRDLGPCKFIHGYGSSPAVIEGLLVVPNDQEKGGSSSVVALEPVTGETRWQVARESTRAAYSAPCLFAPTGGPAQILLASSAHGVSSHDPKTGKRNWEIEIEPKERVVASPVVASGLVIASAGSGGTGKKQVAVRPGNPATGAKPQLAYELKGGLPYVPTPVAKDGLLFLIGDRGTAKCVKAPTGEVRWQEQLEGTFYGSPVLVGDRLYCASKEGNMFVLAAKPEFKLLAKFSLGEPSFATPAVANGVMFVRTHSRLMAVGAEGDSADVSAR